MSDPVSQVVRDLYDAYRFYRHYRDALCREPGLGICAFNRMAQFRKSCDFYRTPDQYA